MWQSDPEDHFVICPLPLVFGFGTIIYSFYHSGLWNCVLQVSIQMVGVLINWYLFPLVYGQGKRDISIRVLERVAGHPDSFIDSRNKALENHWLTVRGLFPLTLENRRAKSGSEGLCCQSVGQETSHHFPKYYSCLVLCLAFFLKWVRMLQKIVMVGAVRTAAVALRTTRVARAGDWLVDVPLRSVSFCSITV